MLLVYLIHIEYIDNLLIKLISSIEEFIIRTSVFISWEALEALDGRDSFYISRRALTVCPRFPHSIEKVVITSLHLSKLGLLRLQVEWFSDVRLVSVYTLLESGIQVQLDQLFLNLIIQVSVISQELVSKIFDLFDFFCGQFKVDIGNLQSNFNQRCCFHVLSNGLCRISFITWYTFLLDLDFWKVELEVSSLEEWVPLLSLFLTNLIVLYRFKEVERRKVKDLNVEYGQCVVLLRVWRYLRGLSSITWR